MIRLLPLALALAACPQPQDSRTPRPEVGRLADRLVLLDDFASETLDGVWRWRGGDTQHREARNGTLVLEARDVYAETPGLGGVVNAVRTVETGRIDHLGVKVRVDDFEALDATAAATAGLTYQPTADRGTEMNRVDIRVQLFATRSRALAPGVNAFRCLDDACDAWEDLPVDWDTFPHTRGLEAGTTHDLEVAWDDVDGRFHLTFDGGAAWIDASTIPDFDPSDFRYAELRAHAFQTGAAGKEARMHAHFTDVTTDGALYDDFVARGLDLDRWSTGEHTRRVEGGALVLESTAREVGTTMLPLRGASGVEALAAHIRIETSEHGGAEGEAPLARLGGYWYATEEHPPSEGARGQVFAFVGLRGAAAVWSVARCDDADCGEVKVFGSGVLEDGIAPGETRQLYIGFNGAHFTFQVEDDAPVSFDAVASGLPMRGRGHVTTKGPMIRHAASSAQTQRVRAAFDEVRTTPVGAVRATRAQDTWEWSTRATYGSLEEVVAIGPDPNDPSRILLLASASEPDHARALVLVLTTSAGGGLPDGFVTGGVLHLDGDDTLVTDGTVSVDHFDGSMVRGTFSVALATGGTLDGTFRTPWVPAAFPPPPAGSELSPAPVDPWCSEDLFCDFAVAGDRETWLSIPVPSGAGRAVRVLGDADLRVVRADRSTEVCRLDSSGPTEKACNLSASEVHGDRLFAVITPRDGAAARIPVAIHEDYTLEGTGGTAEHQVRVGTHRWHRYLVSPESAHLFTVLPFDEAHAGLDVWDDAGRFVVGNGWCCGVRSESSPNGVHDLFVPGGAESLWARFDVGGDPHTSDLEAHRFHVSLSQAHDGQDPIHAIGRLPADSLYSQLTHTFRAGGSLYLSFLAAQSGPYLFRAEAMDWASTDGPIDLGLFTDPLDPARSGERLGWDEDCVSEPIDGRWTARCYALLKQGAHYYARLDERDGRDGVVGVFRAEAPWSPATILADGDDANGTFPFGTDTVRRYAAWAEEGHGLRFGGRVANTSQDAAFFRVIDHATPRDGCEAYCDHPLLEAWTEPGYDIAMMLGESDLPPFVQLEVSANPNADLGHALRLTRTGSGERSSAPFEVAFPSTVMFHGRLPAGGSHHYRFTASQSQTTTLQVSSPGSAWADGFVSVQDHTAQIGGTCQAINDRNIQWRTDDCTFPLTAGHLFTISIHNTASGVPAPYRMQR